MLVYDRFSPTLERQMPVAYAFGPEQKSLVAQLSLHGVFIEELEDTLSVRAESFVIDSVVRLAPFEYRNPVRLEGRWGATPQTLRAGTFIVREAQQLGILAMYLLEPESDDGLATWNFLDQWLGPGKTFPVIRVVEPFNTNAPLHQARP
jgi:hypothetical protein